MWFPFALLAGLIAAGRRVYEKKLTGFFGNFAMGFIVNAFSLLPTLILIFTLPGGTEIGDLPWRFWWPLIIIWLVLYPIQTYFFYRAVRESDVSTVTPVMCLLPVFNVGTSFLLLGEVPSVFGFLGILLIVFGTYFILKHGDRKSGISMPVVFAIIAIFSMAVGGTLDKIAVQASNPVFYGFVNTFGASIVFLLLMFWYKEKASFGEMISVRWFWPLVFLGVLKAVVVVTTMYALNFGPTSYVLAIRAGSYILAGLYGVIILGESFSTRKLIAFIFFGVGVLALAFA